MGTGSGPELGRAYIENWMNQVIRDAIDRSFLWTGWLGAREKLFIWIQYHMIVFLHSIS